MMTQTQWRLCSKCNSVFYSGNSSSGVCAAGGAHTAEFIGCPPVRLTLAIDQPGVKVKLGKTGGKLAQTERGWSRCRKCECLFFAIKGVGGICPADGGSHQGDHLVQYQVQLKSIHNLRDADARMKKCGKCQSMFRDSNWMPGVKQPDHAGVCPGRPEPAFPTGLITTHNGKGSNAYALDVEVLDSKVN